jgi:septum formation protein
MKAVGFDVIIESPQTDEDFPSELPVDQVARYLAEKKAESFRPEIHDEVVITADTVVILGNEILNKPAHPEEAIEMLEKLSGKTHLVMTGVCILSKEREMTIDESTYVTFRELSRGDIEKYIDHHKPYDKAGAYGAQDCLTPNFNPCTKDEIEFLDSIGKPGLVDKTITSNTKESVVLIEKIDGSYFNVMGFPIHKIYPVVQSFL